MILITGCGRSGTTMLFDLLKANIGQNSICLNEPRLLHLPKLDLWSPNANDIDGDCQNYIENLRTHILSDGLIYLEKMPEHTLRP